MQFTTEVRRWIEAARGSVREISDARAFDRPISSLDYDIEGFHRSSTDIWRKYICDAIAITCTIMRDDDGNR